jgi:hypothetical protein
MTLPSDLLILRPCASRTIAWRNTWSRHNMLIHGPSPPWPWFHSCNNLIITSLQCEKFQFDSNKHDRFPGTSVFSCSSRTINDVLYQGLK